jgi:hypothetical protein
LEAGFHFVPEGRAIVARRFIAGLAINMICVPEGRLKLDLGCYESGRPADRFKVKISTRPRSNSEPFAPGPKGAVDQGPGWKLTVAIPSPCFELLANLKPLDPVVPSSRFVNLWLPMIDLTDSNRLALDQSGIRCNFSNSCGLGNWEVSQPPPKA